MQPTLGAALIGYQHLYLPFSVTIVVFLSYKHERSSVFTILEAMIGLGSLVGCELGGQLVRNPKTSLHSPAKKPFAFFGFSRARSGSKVYIC